MGIEPRFQTREPQSKVKLVVRAVAHSIGPDQPPVGPYAFEHGTTVAVVVDLQPDERTAGQSGEQGARTSQDRSLILLAISFNAPVQDRRGELEGRITRGVSLELDEERLNPFGTLGSSVATVHASQFCSLGADGLIETAQLFLVSGKLVLELFDRCFQCAGISPFNLGGKIADVGTSRLDQQLLGTGCEVRIEVNIFLGTTLGLGKVVDIGTACLLTETIERNPCYPAPGFRVLELALGTFPLLQQRGVSLRGGPGVAQEPEQLARLVSRGPTRKLRGDAHHKGGNIPGEQLSVAVDAADPAQMLAPLFQVLEQLVDPSQDNLSLLGRGIGFQPVFEPIEAG